MKVFVYSKKTSKKIATIVNVIKIELFQSNKVIVFYTETGEKFSFNTRNVKTTIYQN